ncbi:hypothetical protein A3E45_01240 [Candidatus Daviesbacteria bacterium RIFCSPHIGHO2_12_FULL_43_11]|uniref:Glycosyltransferase RgtA/B/C/D-like domain-containing protein n=2 Tax=Candidatus Daviesiibacteriota TaxID=1752718 RepID=A0A1F5K6H2_9BACT|nr:MAG: hypothetical protein A3E45_01240 [Candidatus Daviesbacteria bacterium RIFCSPHIGHO2_12_FULL_43_11]
MIMLVGIGWLLFISYNSARQAWVDGLMEAWFMSKGLVIYKDFASQYFPTLYFLMVPFHRIFGFVQNPTIFLAPFTSIVTFITLAIISCKILKGWYRFLPLIFFLIWDPVLSENHYSTTMFQNTLILVAFGLWWSWFDKPRKIYAFIIGLLLGIASTSGQIVSIFSAVVGFSILYRVIKERSKVHNIIFFSAGFLIPYVFIFSWLFYHGALEAFFNWAIAYYFSGGGYPYAMGRGWENLLFYFTFFSPLIFVVILFFQKKGLMQSKRTFWLLMFLTFLVPFWFAIFHPNRLMTVEAIMAISLGLSLQELTRNRKKINFLKGVSVFLLAMLIITFYFVMIPIYKRNFSHPPETRNRTATYPDDPMYEINKWVINNTPKEAKLFATTDSIIYLETDRLMANPRAVTNLPVFYREINQAALELQDNPPDYWVIDERQWKRFEDMGFTQASQVLQKILSCEQVIFQAEYVTIRKHEAGKDLCL